MSMRMTTALVAMGLALAMAAPVSVDAAVIYEENFNGDATNLAGKAPDTRPGTETWTADSKFKRNGTVTGGRSSAHLPFAPTSGNVYKLTATFGVTQESLTVGFADSASGTLGQDWRSYPSFGTGRVHYDAGDEDHTIYAITGSGGTDGEEIAAGVELAGSGLVTFEIILDATDAVAANWTVAWSATDGASTWTRSATTAAAGSFGDIDYLLLTHGTTTSADGGEGSFEYLKLETVVPEPASMVLMLVGSTLLLCRSRR